MSLVRRMLTNFSKGELSPLLEGRPDLASYFEGASKLENWYILRQGGVTRRPGTRYVADVKFHAKDTILIPFETSVSAAYILEFGDQYIRFYKNKAQIKTSAGGPPVEVVSPYTEAQLRDIHFTQSVDVLYLTHPNVPPYKLSRLSDTNWALQQIQFRPTPSFEDDTDISGSTVTLTPAATTGSSVIFTASGAVFLEADVGRTIKYGVSKAIIVAFGASAGDIGSPNAHVRADIIDAFPDTNPIPAGLWLIGLSPQCGLNPDVKQPIGARVTLVATKNAFRSADVGKYINIYSGIVKINTVSSPTTIIGELQSVMESAADLNPIEAPTGSWTMEVASWSTTNKFPRTPEFYQGRLAYGATTKQPTTFWLSASDDFESYPVGIKADNAIEYTMATKGLNQIEWLVDSEDLFVGTAGSEHKVKSGVQDTALGGDKVPLVNRMTSHGCAHIQPVVIDKRIIFVDRSLLKILSIAFSLEEDSFVAYEITGSAEHITSGGIALGPLGFAKRPDPRLFFTRSDGQMITLTYFQYEKVIGFTRLTTLGLFKCGVVIPQAAPKEDQVWLIVQRSVGGTPKKYIEVVDMSPSEFSTRQWQALQTDCAKIYDGSATVTITGLSHLEGMTVDVIADGSDRGTKVVSGGQIVLDEAASKIEVGLHYDSELITMRPAIEGSMVEGLPRSWIKIWIRVKDTLGGLINGEQISYPASALDTLIPYTGDRDVTGYGSDTVGKITVKQDRPYPMTILAIFGEITFGDHG